MQLKRDYAWARRKRAGLIRIELYAEKLSIIEGDFRCDDGVVFVIESIKIGLYNRYLLSKYYVRPTGVCTPVIEMKNNFRKFILSNLIF